MTSQAHAVRSPSGVRDPLLDNARAVLIALVVIGHLVSRVPHSTAADTIYLWVYGFHMPAFALISGYLAQRARADAAAWHRLAVGLLLPYAAFQTLDVAVHIALDPRHRLGAMSLARPEFALWFLLALFTWRLLAPILRTTVWAIPVTILIALLAPLGGGVGAGFGAARTLSFLPFFTIGLWLSPEHLRRFSAWSAGVPQRVGAMAVLLAAAVPAFLLRSRLPRAALRSDTNYAGMGLHAVSGIATRLVLIAVALLLIAALLAAAPRTVSPLTTVGRSTLYVYLLHSVVVGPLLPRLGRIGSSPWTVLLLVLAGLAVTALLASSPVRRATGWLVEPRLGVRLQRPPAAAA